MLLELPPPIPPLPNSESSPVSLIYCLSVTAQLVHPPPGVTQVFTLHPRTRYVQALPVAVCGLFLKMLHYRRILGGNAVTLILSLAIYNTM